MAYYTALISEWPSLKGTTDEKLTAINTMTVPVSGQPIPWSAIKIAARTSSTGDWSRIVALSRQTPALPPVTEMDAAILAAINATEADSADIVHPSDPAEWGAFQTGMAALQVSGDLSAATAATISALVTVDVLWWRANGYLAPINLNDLAAAGGLV